MDTVPSEHTTAATDEVGAPDVTPPTVDGAPVETATDAAQPAEVSALDTPASTAPLPAPPDSAPPVPAPPVAAPPVPAPPVPAPPVPAPPVPTPPAPTAPAGGRPTDPAGYVDADGTVYVHTADGPRAIGSWQAGSSVDALEFYRRRFDGLVIEVDILTKRITETDVPLKEANAAIERLRASIVEATVIGDLDGLTARVDALTELARTRSDAARAAKAAATAAAKVTKERIVADAEAIAGATEWKIGGDRLRVLLEEWKAVPRLDRKSDDELWTRFSAARSTYGKRRKAHYAELTSTRDSARSAKEALVAKAESLANSTDWGSTAATYRDLMTQWKGAGRARKETDEELWTRFRAAQDSFFAARTAALSARDSEHSSNLAAKEELLGQAERLLPVTDARSARNALRSLQQKWDGIGHVPRDAKPKLDRRLAVVEAAIAEAEEVTRKRSNPAAKARAQETVDALLAAIAGYEAKAAKAQTAGNAKAAADATASAQARREWLVEAERLLAEFA
ncbi:MAG: DUF349 domain-containing protein [Sporichthyaceae bacterium]